MFEGSFILETSETCALRTWTNVEGFVQEEIAVEAKHPFALLALISTSRLQISSFYFSISSFRSDVLCIMLPKKTQKSAASKKLLEQKQECTNKRSFYEEKM